MRSKKKLKRDKLKTEQDQAAVVEAVGDLAADETTAEDKLVRDINMFKGWVMGKTYDQLAEENNLSRQTVWTISKKYNWRNLRNDLRTRRFKKTQESMVDFTVWTHDALEADARKAVQDAIDAKRPLSKEERDHLFRMYDRLLKEIRLEDGKPTDIGTGAVQVEIVLPPGAKRFGIVPPDPKVKVIEMTKTDNPIVNLDDIEHELKEPNND